MEITDYKVRDSKVAPVLIDNSGKIRPDIKGVIGDVGYDDKDVYKHCEDRNIYLITKPRKNAVQRVGRYYRKAKKS